MYRVPIVWSLLVYSCVQLRETREGWPLLTFETEVNGGSKSTNERGPSLIGSLGVSCWYQRFLFCLGCSSQPSTKYFFSSLYTISIHFSPLPSKLGMQSCWVACLLACVSGSAYRCSVVCIPS
jgi:hypothetical protein